MARLAVFSAATLLAARAAQLPSIHADAPAAEGVRSSAKWWAHVGDKVFFAPPASMLELSQEVSHYYYALGSESALTSEMQAHRVGGEGRWHIFHLPKGPSMLQLQSNGDRRSSLSSLMQLREGDVLPSAFPEYPTNNTYVHPGTAKAQQLEREAVASVAAPVFTDFLTRLTSLPGTDGAKTRSWTNPSATRATQEFLKSELSSMGLTTCIHNFNSNGRALANVVGYMPGTSGETVTVGAHYDSRPYDGAAPGAEDNGSGVASLLTVAKAFTAKGLKPVRQLYFVGFAAEEPGLIGSKEFADALSSGKLPEGCSPPPSFLQTNRRKGLQGNPRHAGIIMDEVGWKSPNLPAPTVNLESKDWTFDVMNHLAQANLMHNGANMKVVHNNAPFGSDHMSFLDNNMQGVLVINGDDEKYPHYHQSSDTMDSVDSEYAAQIAKMVLGGLARVGGLQP